MKHGLYYCDTSNLMLGLIDAYRLNWISVASARNPARLASTGMIKDEFGDEYVQVDLEFQSNLEVPIKSFRYRHRAGDTGFSFFKTNEYGHSPDRELRDLLDWILRDAWTWDFERQNFISYAKEKERLEYPLDFFLVKERGQPCIAFHSPDNFASMSNDFYKMQGAEKLEALLGLTEGCQMITNWRPAYGENPIILSREMDEVLDDLKGQCESRHLAFVRVPGESKLPEW